MARENQHYMTEQERYKLEGYLETGKPISWIAQKMGFSRQTIYNELHRGSSGTDTPAPADYSAARGQDTQQERSQKKGCPQKIGNDLALANFLEAKMLGIQPDGSIDKRKRFSPAAALQAAREAGFTVNISVSTLYNYIDQGLFLKLTNADLWEKTSRKPRKKREKPKVAHENLPNIEQRPEEINERSEPGHWEMDLVVGPTGTKPCLLTLTERTRREEIIIRLPNRKAATVRRALNKLERKTENFREKFKSITTDDGSEFMEYEKLKQSATHKGERFRLYYCHSYAAWEKGSNENHNRIIRRWFPKGTDFNRVSKKEVQECQDWMNNYPRKILDWKTPAQMAA